MDWSILIALTIVAALAYGYWDHTRQRRHLGKSFAVLAARYRGQATPGNLLLLPQLRFERNGCRYLVAALATDGSDSGESGPFTFVDLELPFDTGREIHVKRGTGGGKRLMEAIGAGRPTTGHREFDEAFQIETSDQVFTSALLELRVREKLLSSRARRIEVKVAGKKISVHRDGIAESTADLEELIDIAGLLADHCPANLGTADSGPR